MGHGCGLCPGKSGPKPSQSGRRPVSSVLPQDTLLQPSPLVCPMPPCSAAGHRLGGCHPRCSLHIPAPVRGSQSDTRLITATIPTGVLTATIGTTVVTRSSIFMVIKSLVPVLALTSAVTPSTTRSTSSSTSSSFLLLPLLPAHPIGWATWIAHFPGPMG